MKKYWFKAKNYGWGWYPATWQGWLVIVIFVLLINLDFYRINSLTSSMDSLIYFIPDAVISTIILIVICYLKGEKPPWRWGQKSKKS